MPLLAPGTPTSDSTDPRTVEQNATIQWILAENANKPKPQYSGFLILPNGTLTNDRSYLHIPDDRKREIEAALAMGTDPKQTGVAGNVLVLDVNGIPVRYVKVQSIAEAIDLASISNIINEPDELQEPVDLSSVVIVDVEQVQRTYTKGTLLTLQSQIITFTNISSTIEVQVAIPAAPGLSYTPSAFSLAPNTRQAVTLVFDSTQLEEFADGINTINTIVNLSSNSAVPIPAPISPPPPIIPPTNIPVGPNDSPLNPPDAEQDTTTKNTDSTSDF